MEIRIRHLQRYQEIIQAFVRNGFSYVVKEVGLLDKIPFRKKCDEEESAGEKTTGERICLLLEDLGPSFVKLGQIASTRPDLLSADIIAALEKLQDNVAPVAYEEIEKQIEEELGSPIVDLFKDFDKTPLASASIGQVHRATLMTGEQVAIKIQRPHIKKMVETDMSILKDIARMAEKKLEMAKNQRILEKIEELSNALLTELDYEKEGYQTDLIRKNMETDEAIVVPTIYWEYTTQKVLTMQYLEGVKVNQLAQLDAGNYNRPYIAEKLVHVLFKQILMDGVFHGDPHPGNIIVLPDGKIGLIDFGMVGKLLPTYRYHLGSYVLALKNEDVDLMLRTIEHIGQIPYDLNREKLRMEIEEQKERYLTKAFSEINLSELLSEWLSIVHRYQIHVPADFTILAKSLMTLEGVVSKLDPNINMLKIAEPFSIYILKERYNPKNMKDRIWKQFVEYADTITELPKDLSAIMKQAKEGKTKLEIGVPQLELFLHKLDQISNRLSFSIVLLSFSIIMVGLIIGTSIGHHTTWFWKLPIVEIGFVVATVMVIYLLLKIFRSGKL